MSRYVLSTNEDIVRVMTDLLGKYGDCYAKHSALVQYLEDLASSAERAP